ncbi:MAG: lipopolysaccharide transport periplasmic protein LptA [Gammaproteobacteria bacterium]|nr:lipopolysaccharide transport periplasmic protein LptA [Gammaproteobacteria bacterium]MCZ6883610.1 lipopolysaccharide transport periplasmic protein LptA [Gammaproteobacteria bacterium]
MMARLVSFLVLLLPLQVFALSGDAQQPIHVEADSLEIRDKENISIYSGNVRLSQGSQEFRGERLVLTFSQQKELVLMTMTGTPATFRQIDDQQREMRGQADQMEYRASESTLLLLGNAKFTHVGNTIESNTIRINTETESIQAGSTESDDRVRMLILPKP